MLDGRIFLGDELNYSNTLILDASPHVMKRARALFTNASGVYEKGIYTHRPIKLKKNLTTLKDLNWLMQRYKFEIEEPVLSLIQGGSNQYDEIQLSIELSPTEHKQQLSKDAVLLNGELRDYQQQFLNMFNKVKKMLLADVMGLGKTVQAFSILQEPYRRPALVVVPTHLCAQWERELKKFLPTLTSHVIKGFKNYQLPLVDVYITSYNRLSRWQDTLLGPTFQVNTVIFDEVHELRHSNTDKRYVASQLSQKVEYCLGLSGTPIYNKGNEIWSVLDVIKPECLGEYADFLSEWCTWDQSVYEPNLLNNFLKKSGLMLRRTSKDVSLSTSGFTKNIITLETDIEQMKQVQDVAKMLAMSIVGMDLKEAGESVQEFDWKLRYATGMAKAKPTVEFVKMILEEKEKVILCGWHRDVYEVWTKELAIYNPVMFTGSESSLQKDNAIKQFIEGDSRILIMSLRSGAGVDGLQKVCNTIIFGELDWSPHVMDQLVARLDRYGQNELVNTYYLTITDGADPFMINTLGVKRSQHDGLIEGIKADEKTVVSSAVAPERIRDMAIGFLKNIGEDIPELTQPEGLLKDISDILNKYRLTYNEEAFLQDQIYNILTEDLKDVEIIKEYKLSARSRIDFKIVRGEEAVGIECKIEQTNRKQVYNQVKRYLEEGSIKNIMLVAPWNGISNFKVDGIAVSVYDISKNHI